MQRNKCSKCGHDLDSSNHYLECINQGTWTSSNKKVNKEFQ